MSASPRLRPVPRPGVLAIDLYVPGKSGAPVDMSSIEVTPRPHQQEMLEQLAG